jgi:hypothetical protein
MKRQKLAWPFTNLMNKYEVVAEMGYSSHMLRVIEAEDEKQMDDTQKNNCADIEVFPL